MAGGAFQMSQHRNTTPNGLSQFQKDIHFSDYKTFPHIGKSRALNSFILWILKKIITSTISCCLFAGHVRRSKTFNISDVHEQLLATGGGGSGGAQTSGSHSQSGGGGGGNGTKTLPKPDKNRTGVSSYNLRPALTRTGACLDENFRNPPPPADSASGSRKSSDSSSFDSATSSGGSGGNRQLQQQLLRNDICDDALNEIAAFESFITDFVTRQSDTASSASGGGLVPSLRKVVGGGCTSSPKSSTSGSLVSGVSGSSKNYENNNNNNDYTRMMMSYHHQGSKTLSKEDLKTKRLLVTSSRMVRTLERQKKVVVSPQASEEALLPWSLINIIPWKMEILVPDDIHFMILLMNVSS